MSIVPRPRNPVEGIYPGETLAHMYIRMYRRIYSYNNNKLEVIFSL